MISKHLRIAGRVQGVGFRDWMTAEARTLGLDGWVRNCRDGTVEAVVSGDTAAVEEMVRACRRGPRMANVNDIEETLVDPPEEAGFHRRAAV